MDRSICSELRASVLMRKVLLSVKSRCRLMWPVGRFYWALHAQYSFILHSYESRTPRNCLDPSFVVKYHKKRGLREATLVASHFMDYIECRCFFSGLWRHLEHESTHNSTRRQKIDIFTQWKPQWFCMPHLYWCLFTSDKKNISEQQN